LGQTFRVICIGATLFSSACDNLTNRGADGLRLAGLRSSGVDSEMSARAGERLDAVLGRDNSVGGLSSSFAEFTSDSNASYNVEVLATLAFERNPDIRRAVEALNLADVQRLNSIFGYLPQVSLKFGQDQLDQSVVETDNVVFESGEASYEVTTFALSLRQPIFDLSRVFDIQYASVARSKAEVEYAEQSQIKIASLNSRQSLLGRQIARNDTLAREGLVVDAQSAALRSDQSTILSDIASEQSVLSSQLGSLSRMTGVLVEDVATFQPGSSIAGTERTLQVEDAVELGLSNNPEIMVAALSVVESEFLRRGALARDFSPVVEAYAILEEEDRQASRFGGGSITEDTTVGVAVTIPLFNAGGNGYETLNRNVQERAAALDYHASRRELESEIRTTHARLGQLTTSISQARSAVSSASSAVEAERRRVNAGESVDIALAGREIRLVMARNRLQFQQIEYYRAWASLKFLTGADLSAGDA
jgi:outer membrane protein TolC